MTSDMVGVVPLPNLLNLVCSDVHFHLQLYKFEIDGDMEDKGRVNKHRHLAQSSRNCFLEPILNVLLSKISRIMLLRQ